MLGEFKILTIPNSRDAVTIINGYMFIYTQFYIKCSVLILFRQEGFAAEKRVKEVAQR